MIRKKIVTKFNLVTSTTIYRIKNLFINGNNLKPAF